MKYDGLIRKSRTYDFAALLAVMGVVQMALPELLDLWEIPARWAGLATMFVGVVVALLRHATTGPVGAKE